MEDFIPLISLKLADGSFVELFKGLKPSKKKLTVVAAHDHQVRTVLDFYLRSESNREGEVLAKLEFEEKSAELVDETSFEIIAEVDHMENLIITVRSSSGVEKTVEVFLKDTLDKIFPVGKQSSLADKKPLSGFSVFLIALFAFVGLGLCLFLAVFLSRILSSDPPPPLVQFFQTASGILAVHTVYPLG